MTRTFTSTVSNCYNYFPDVVILLIMAVLGKSLFAQQVTYYSITVIKINVTEQIVLNFFAKLNLTSSSFNFVIELLTFCE